MWTVASVLLGFASTPEMRVIVTSPYGKQRAELTVAGGALLCCILLDGKQILAPSGLGISTDGIELCRNEDLGTAKFKVAHETYRFFDAHSEIKNTVRVFAPVTSNPS
jgi:hypothetical protein